MTPELLKRLLRDGYRKSKAENRKKKPDSLAAIRSAADANLLAAHLQSILLAGKPARNTALQGFLFQAFQHFCYYKYFSLEKVRLFSNAPGFPVSVEGGLLDYAIVGPTDRCQINAFDLSGLTPEEVRELARKIDTGTSDWFVVGPADMVLLLARASRTPSLRREVFCFTDRSFPDLDTRSRPSICFGIHPQ